MMQDREIQQQEVDQNFVAFEKLLPDLMKQDPGRWALMHNRKIVAIFDTSRDACIVGRKLYTDKPFSVQEIDDKPINLRRYSHVKV